ncbi:MAG: hypothetical protein KC933_04730 [Myxococcales bacterium]|nr:hypothetical protein [Myxococcales bacterium]
MKVAVVHQAVPPGAAPDVADVLDQVQAVQVALRELGHEVLTHEVTLDLGALDRALTAERPDVVVNLVEELGGQGQLGALVPAFLAARRLPFTGSRAPVLCLADDKLAAKARMVELELPTPAWRWVGEPWRPVRPRGAVIVKSVFEHGSLGLDDDAVVRVVDDAALDALIAERAPKLGGAAFAEAYVHGRELNISVLEVDGRPRCLPPAEISFLGLPEGAPHLVGYDAKWTPGSAEWDATPRKQAFTPDDHALLERLASLARQAFVGFGLAGYGRVDFRVDEGGHPFILEVNANPCLAPGAGFEAALTAAGLSFTEAVGHLLARALETRT